MMQTAATSALPFKLCHAPSAKIPHPPHEWVGLDLADAKANPDGAIKMHAWYCDGWLRLRPACARRELNPHTVTGTRT